MSFQKILVVAATAAELGPLMEKRREDPAGWPRQVELLITGVGMVHTALSLGKALSASAPQLVINAGVAGSFREELRPGTVVCVLTEQYGDLGAQDEEQYLDWMDIGLQDPDAFPFTGGRLHLSPLPVAPVLLGLPKVNGLTVNTVHGNEASIRMVMEKYDAQTETMEGAAFAQACLTAGVPCLELRAISNRVEKRNREAWQLKEAIAALNHTLDLLLTQLAAYAN